MKPVINKQRTEVLALLEAHPYGMSAREIEKATAISFKAVQHRLGRAYKVGLVAKIGNREYCLWGLPENVTLATQRHNRLRAAAKKRGKALTSAREKRVRQDKIRQRVVPATRQRNWGLPSVNSVWSLAA